MDNRLMARMGAIFLVLGSGALIAALVQPEIRIPASLLAGLGLLGGLTLRGLSGVLGLGQGQD